MCGCEYLDFNCGHTARGRFIPCPARFNMTLEHEDKSYHTKAAGPYEGYRQKRKAEEAQRQAASGSRK